MNSVISWHSSTKPCVCESQWSTKETINMFKGWLGILIASWISWTFFRKRRPCYVSFRTCWISSNLWSLPIAIDAWRSWNRLVCYSELARKLTCSLNANLVSYYIEKRGTLDMSFLKKSISSFFMFNCSSDNLCTEAKPGPEPAIELVLPAPGEI